MKIFYEQNIGNYPKFIMGLKQNTFILMLCVYVVLLFSNSYFLPRMGWREGFFGDVIEDLAGTGLNPRRTFPGFKLSNKAVAIMKNPVKKTCEPISFCFLRAKSQRNLFLIFITFQIYHSIPPLKISNSKIYFHHNLMHQILLK